MLSRFRPSSLVGHLGGLRPGGVREDRRRGVRRVRREHVTLTCSTLLDDVKAGGETLSLGVDYKLSKTTKLYGYYTTEDANSATKEADYAGIGIEMKF